MADVGQGRTDLLFGDKDMLRSDNKNGADQSANQAAGVMGLRLEPERVAIRLGSVSLLRHSLAQIENELAELVSISPVRVFDRGDGLGPPVYYFETPGKEQLRLQLPLKARFVNWYARLTMLLRDYPADLSRRAARGHALASAWIDLTHHPALSPDAAQNAEASRRALATLAQVIDHLEVGDDLMVVPDAQSLMISSELSRYRSVAGVTSYTLALIPTVLSELSSLVHAAPDPPSRRNAEIAIGRIKAWRRRGNLADGVAVQRGITVRAVAREPDVRRSLRWLDPMNRDDRIIASTLELRTAQRSATVLLVTADINLQNKAEAAGIAYAELPRNEGKSGLRQRAAT